MPVLRMLTYISSSEITRLYGLPKESRRDMASASAHEELELDVLLLRIISADADRRHSAASTRRYKEDCQFPKKTWR